MAAYCGWFGLRKLSGTGDTPPDVTSAIAWRSTASTKAVQKRRSEITAGLGSMNCGNMATHTPLARLKATDPPVHCWRSCRPSFEELSWVQRSSEPERKFASNVL